MRCATSREEAPGPTQSGLQQMPGGMRGIEVPDRIAGFFVKTETAESCPPPASSLPRSYLKVLDALIKIGTIGEEESF